MLARRSLSRPRVCGSATGPTPEWVALTLDYYAPPNRHSFFNSPRGVKEPSLAVALATPESRGW
jgi:hypothetical protein